MENPKKKNFILKSHYNFLTVFNNCILYLAFPNYISLAFDTKQQNRGITHSQKGI